MSIDTLAELPAAALERLSLCFPARAIQVGRGVQVAVRECGQPDGPALVCLHGIGSGAASWLDFAQEMAPRMRVIAWDAPGYGDSTPLPQASPGAQDYAQRLHDMLDALGVARCVLLGHSLGALVAAAAVRRCERGAGRFAALVLVSPAQGYGAPGQEAVRQRVRAERLASFDEWGIAAMAALRSDRLVSSAASPLARQWVRWNMARLNDHGYRQAIELLCQGQLLADLPLPVSMHVPVHVACGALDGITPPEGCEHVALHCGVRLQVIDHAGHACYVERPAAVAAFLGSVLATAHSDNRPT